MHIVPASLAVLMIAAASACAGGDPQTAASSKTAAPATTDGDPTTTVSSTTTVDELASPAETSTPDDGTLNNDAGRVGLTDVLCTPAPAATTSVLPRPPWAEGVERDLELEFGRQDLLSDPAAGLSLTPARLTVEGGENSEWSFEWEAESTVTEALPLPPESLRQQEPLLAEIPLQRVRYRLGEYRQWLGIDNPDEIRQSALTGLDFVAEAMPAEQQLIEQSRQLFAGMNDEQLSVAFAGDPIVFHTLEGAELEVDGVIEFEDLLPNALGGEPIPSITTVRVAELIDDDGCVAIEMRMVPDPEQLIAIVVDTARATFGSELTEAELEAFAESLEVESVIGGQYDHGSGFFRRVASIQRVAIGFEERIDTRIITDVTPD